MREDLLATKFIFPRQVLHSDFHNEIVRSELTRHIDTFSDAISLEIRAALEDVWDGQGSDPAEWREVNIQDTIHKVIRRVVARIFVGEPLCHDVKYLNFVSEQAMSIAMTGSAIRFLLPELLRPVLGFVFGLPARYYTYRVNSYWKPLIRDCARQLQSRTNGDPSPAPPTLLQFAVRGAFASPSLASPSLADHSPTTIATYLAFLSFAALHTSTFTAASLLLGLATSPPSAGYLASLRAEAAASLGAHRGRWTRAATAALPRADSAIRESLRLGGFGGRAMPHQVVSPAGVRLPSGEWLPPGARVVIPAAGIHRDPDLYPRPNEFVAFRFCGHGDGGDGIGSEEAGADAAPAEKGHGKYTRGAGRVPLVRTSADFLAFAHGPHACPGRHFAAHVLKTLLAEVVLAYDVAHLTEQPPRVKFMDASLPAQGVTLRVRRRQGEGSKEG